MYEFFVCGDDDVDPHLSGAHASMEVDFASQVPGIADQVSQRQMDLVDCLCVGASVHGLCILISQMVQFVPLAEDIWIPMI